MTYDFFIGFQFIGKFDMFKEIVFGKRGNEGNESNFETTYPFTCK